MKPVDQTLFGLYGAESGNSYQACVASVLERELSDVPHFFADAPPEDTPARDMEAWTNARNSEMGLWMLEQQLLTPGWTLPIHPFLYTMLAGSELIACGTSPRREDSLDGVYEMKHYVVMTCKNGALQLLHDPHPSRAGLLGLPEYVEVLLPTQSAHKAEIAAANAMRGLIKEILNCETLEELDHNRQLISMGKVKADSRTRELLLKGAEILAKYWS